MPEDGDPLNPEAIQQVAQRRRVGTE